jgi:hypothetical protein
LEWLDNYCPTIPFVLPADLQKFFYLAVTGIKN